MKMENLFSSQTRLFVFYYVCRVVTDNEKEMEFRKRAILIKFHFKGDLTFMNILGTNFFMPLTLEMAHSLC